MNDLVNKLIGDTSFWVALSTILFFTIAFFKARTAVADGLTQRTEAIRQRLDEAETLRREAEAFLMECKARADRASEEAKEIVENAHQRAEKMRIQMETDFAAMLSREESRAKIRISRMENEAIDAIKNSIISEAITHVTTAVANDAKVKPSIDATLDDVKEVLKK